MLVIEGSLTIYLAKLVADMTAYKYPSITQLIIEEKVESLVEKYGVDSGFKAITSFLRDNGVSEEEIKKFSTSFMNIYFSLDMNMLPYNYFQLEHVQKVIRSRILSDIPRLRGFIKGRLEDSEWTIIVDIMGEFFKNTTFALIPKDQSSIMGYYIKQLPFAIKDSDLTKTGLGKIGLDTEIGETTLTPLHNQSEVESEDKVREDLPNFNEIVSMIYEPSFKLFSRTPNHRETYVTYDLLSDLKSKVMQDVRDKISDEIRRVFRGRTGNAPNFEVESLIHYHEGSTANIIDSVRSITRDRSRSLGKIRDLMKGFSSLEAILDAMIFHYDANYAPSGTKTDGKFMYYNYKFDSSFVSNSILSIIKGYGAVKKILDFCKKTNFDFMRIPVEGFRSSIGSNFTTLLEYVETVELAQKLEKESKGLPQPEVLSENYLYLKNKLGGTKLSEIYTEDMKKLLADLNFMVHFVHNKGIYDASSHDPNTEISRSLKMLAGLVALSKVPYAYWRALREGNTVLVSKDNYSISFGDNIDSNYIFGFFAFKKENDKEGHFNASPYPWLDKDKMRSFYVETFPQYLAHLLTDKLPSSELARICLTMQSANLVITLRTLIINNFVSKMFTKSGSALTVTPTGYVLRDGAEIFRIFCEDPKLVILSEIPDSFEGKLEVLSKLGIYSEYNTEVSDVWMDSMLVKLFDLFKNIYHDVFSLLSYLYLSKVTSVIEMFDHTKFSFSNVPYQYLIDFISGLYDPPNPYNYMANPQYQIIMNSYKRDETYGIFMLPNGRSPYMVKDSSGRPAFVHDSGTLVSYTVSGLISNYITEETEIRRWN